MKWKEIFENSNPAWHGSPHALSIDKLRASRGGELGPGLYFSYDYKTAAGYAMSSGEDRLPGGVLELDISHLNILEITRQDWLDKRSKLMDQYRAENDGEWKGEFYDKAIATMINDFEAQGYDGLYDDWRQGIVFPNRVDQIRIVDRKQIR